MDQSYCLRFENYLMKVSIRSAIKNDYRAIAALHAKSWQQNYRGTFSDHFLDNEVLEDRLTVWKDRLEKPKRNQFIHIAEIDNSFGAFICGYIDEDSAFGTLIDNLHVDSEFIGRGIGEKLMLETALFLEKQDKVSMYLWVLTSNRKAISFYERLGGKPMETVNDFDIGDREITKTRYHWPNLKLILGLDHIKKNT